MSILFFLGGGGGGLVLFCLAAKNNSLGGYYDSSNPATPELVQSIPSEIDLVYWVSIALFLPLLELKTVISYIAKGGTLGLEHHRHKDTDGSMVLKYITIAQDYYHTIPEPYVNKIKQHRDLNFKSPAMASGIWTCEFVKYSRICFSFFAPSYVFGGLRHRRH